jgi:hypothetical protein
VLPDVLEKDCKHNYINILSKNLKIIREAASKYQQELKAKRVSNNPEIQDMYEAGMFVMIMTEEKKGLKGKLYPRNLGPYEVIKQVTNNVTLKSLIDGKVKTVDVSILKVFLGDYGQALHAAKMDDDQEELEKILSFEGNYLERSSCIFKLLFSDGTIIDQYYSTNISTTVAFQEFCSYPMYLTNLLKTVAELKKEQVGMNKETILLVKPGDIVYICLRALDYEKYVKSSLPDKFSTEYVTRGEYGSYRGKHQKEIAITFPDIKKSVMVVNNWFVHYIGSSSMIDNGQVVIDDRLKKLYQSIVKEGSVARH